MSGTDRFDLLMEMHLDGALDAAGEAELRDLLAARPDLRAEYVASLTQEAALRNLEAAALTATARHDLHAVQIGRAHV
jgi:anti-sigma factor RsiW